MDPVREHAQVPAAYEVLAVLRYIGSQAAPVRASVIAREVGLPRSTTYHLLTALIRGGFITHLPEEHKYTLGVTAHELGTGYARQAPLQRIAKYPLVRLVARTHRTAHLAVMHGRDVVYVIEERPPRGFPLITNAGVRLPAHLTASGRAMMAWMPDPQIAALYPDPSAFTTRNGHGPRTLRELTAILRHVRLRGFAWEVGEVTAGFSSIAVPVLDRMHQPVASVAITVPDDELHRDELKHEADETDLDLAVTPFGPLPPSVAALAARHVAELVECARELTRRLGAHSDDLELSGPEPGRS